MSLINNDAKPWSNWHKRLHKRLKTNKNLLPSGSSLLLSISGGQDSMALLKLIIDLKRIYRWKIQIWHGDHGWHEGSQQISKELEQWCLLEGLPFYCARTNKNSISTENEAREWRYQNLIKQAKLISNQHSFRPCRHVLTGHTGSDRAETLIMNIARGTYLDGLSSLKEIRTLDENIQLIRPMLIFSRTETIKICEELKMPIWLDPSNENVELSRNRIRKEIFPVLEKLHRGSTMRIAQLANRFLELNNDQQQLTKLAIEALSEGKGISRKKIYSLTPTVRSIILNKWIKDNKAPTLSANQLEELSHKISKNNPPGSIQLKQDWEIAWDKNLITIINPSN